MTSTFFFKLKGNNRRSPITCSYSPDWEIMGAFFVCQAFNTLKKTHNTLQQFPHHNKNKYKPQSNKQLCN